MAFIDFYQNIPQYIDPIAFSIGPLSVGWYGLMWLAGFACVYFLLLWRVRRGESKNIDTNTDAEFVMNKESLQDLIFTAFIGAIIGGRLGYVLFYDAEFYLRHPLEIISPYDFSLGEWIGISGMSYHGGAIGVVIAVALFARKEEIDFWRLIDFLVPAVALGYFFGRIGNFLNGELFGRITDKPWGMYFGPETSGELLRHPSQLYEACGEGIVIFIILWFLRNKKLPYGMLGVLYLFLYGAFRFVIEFYRLPDVHIGLNMLTLSRGQMLSLGMIGVSIIVALYMYKREK